MPIWGRLFDGRFAETLALSLNLRVGVFAAASRRRLGIFISGMRPEKSNCSISKAVNSRTITPTYIL